MAQVVNPGAVFHQGDEGGSVHVVVKGHFAFRVAAYEDRLAHLRSRGVAVWEMRVNVTAWA